MKRYARSLCLLSLVILALVSSACGGRTPEVPNFVIDGTVFAPSGGNVLDTLIQVCYQDKCDDSRSKILQITVSAVEASFSFEDLEDAPYSIIAAKDTNSSGTFDAGDYFATSDELFTPPASLEIRLELEN